MPSTYELSFLFGAVRGGRTRGVASFVAALPQLARGALVECDLGARSAGELFACVARFEGPLAPPVRTRLEFWAWRAEATVSPVAGIDGRSGDGDPPVLALCDSVLRRVAPRLLRTSAVALLSELPGDAPILAAPLSLRVDLASPESAGIDCDPVTMAVFVPSPRPLPSGDRLALELRLPDGEVLEAEGVVREASRAGSRGQGSPAGLVVSLGDGRPEVLDALRAHADRRRRAPRYAVRAPVRVKVLAGPAPGAAAPDAPQAAPRPRAAAPATSAPPEDDPEQHVENISQGGAFVRTDLRLASGTRVELGVDLPGGALSVPAVVVHGSERGLGVRFENDAAGEAAVARALEEVSTRRRRALVVDDDRLGRRMLGDALAERGFEVFASENGEDGLKVLIEQLLDLDVLVTDLRMPGIDGEQLLRTIRQAGGEQDLAIVVVSGDVDPSMERRLLSAGADAVLAKRGGGDAVGDAAERALLRRRSGCEGGAGTTTVERIPALHA